MKRRTGLLIGLVVAGFGIYWLYQKNAKAAAVTALTNTNAAPGLAPINVATQKSTSLAPAPVTATGITIPGGDPQPALVDPSVYQDTMEPYDPYSSGLQY